MDLASLSTLCSRGYLCIVKPSPLNIVYDYIDQEKNEENFLLESISSQEPFIFNT